MLRNLRRPDLSQWRPTLSVSTNANVDVKSQENKQFKMKFKAELDEMMKRKRVFQGNTFKAYALIWDCCAKSMQHKIYTRTNFKSDIYNDSIKLLKAIQEHSLNYQKTRNEMAIILDAIQATINLRQ
eukprot:6174449-Ditylum_brightwellii.AAC.1